MNYLIASNSFFGNINVLRLFDVHRVLQKIYNVINIIDDFVMVVVPTSPNELKSFHWLRKWDWYVCTLALSVLPTSSIRLLQNQTPVKSWSRLSLMTSPTVGGYWGKEWRGTIIPALRQHMRCLTQCSHDTEGRRKYATRELQSFLRTRELSSALTS